MFLTKNKLFMGAIFLLSLMVTIPALGQNKTKKSAENNVLEKQSTSKNDPWKLNNVYTPKELAGILSNKKEKNPLIVQVGFSFLYNQSHIPGSVYVGPASRTKGIEKLKSEVKKFKHDKNIVLYCGCCPWGDCPNIRPAFKTVEEMGYKNVHVLYLPNTFVENWVDKGYPSSK